MDRDRQRDIHSYTCKHTLPYYYVQNKYYLLEPNETPLTLLSEKVWMLKFSRKRVKDFLSNWKMHLKSALRCSLLDHRRTTFNLAHSLWKKNILEKNPLLWNKHKINPLCDLKEWRQYSTCFANQPVLTLPSLYGMT